MTRLSNRQFPLLEAFVQNADVHMNIEEAQKWDQRPFRSLLIRGWVRYSPGRGFHVTREGKQAWSEFHETNILRKDPSLPLTRYFDPDAYGLKPRKQGTVREFRRSHAA